MLQRFACSVGSEERKVLMWLWCVIRSPVTWAVFEHRCTYDKPHMSRAVKHVLIDYKGETESTDELFSWTEFIREVVSK